MSEVHLKTRYEIHGSLEWTRDLRQSAPVRHTFTAQVDGRAVAIRVATDDHQMDATMLASVSEDVVAWLEAGRYGTDYPDEFVEALATMGTAVDRLVGILRFTYPLPTFRNAYRSSSMLWSLDGQEWRPAPAPIRPPWTSGYFADRRIDAASILIIQGQLDRPVPPLLAFHHLARAHHERGARHMWIEATIAAELGIKEFLALHLPELKPLLTFVPSPPLEKLYGEILKAHTGTESPWKNRIKEGAGKRNHLIHRPGESEPDIQEACDYVHQVEAALYDLMKRLYPWDETIAKVADEAAGYADRRKAQVEAATKKAQKEAKAKAEKKAKATPRG